MEKSEIQSLAAALRAHAALRAKAGIRWVYPAEFSPEMLGQLQETPVREQAPSAPAAPRLARAPETLEQIRADLGECTRCKLHSTRRNVVFGVGNPHARLMFVGEGPGEDEDREGEPFVGKAGQLLTKIIEAIGLTREDVYIANCVKSRPPGNRNPEPDELAACMPFLERQIDSIKPAIIVGLGNIAVKTLLQTEAGIMKMRGNWKEYRGIAFMPTLHPSYVLRTPEDGRPKIWADFLKVAARYNEGLPPGEKACVIKSRAKAAEPESGAGGGGEEDV